MKTCDLCGADNKEGIETCHRCGFEFPKTISSDMRDKAILSKYDGQDLDQVRKELNKQQTRMRAYLENMDAKSLKKEELVSLLDQALSFMKVPNTIGVDDELNFSKDESNLIKLLFRILERADHDHGTPIATSGTYIRMSNALFFLDEAGLARDMVEKALLINPNNADAQYSKAKLLFYEKDYQGARRCLGKLIEKGQHPKAGYLAELIDQLSS